MARCLKQGDFAGCLNSYGYWVVRVNGKPYYAHRIIYYMRTSVDPGSSLIDHVEGNPSCNSELRLACTKLNGANRKKNKSTKKQQTKSKYKGVSFSNNKYRSKKWTASIQVDNRQIFLGYYNTEEEAAIAYNEAAQKAWGLYANLNTIPKPVA